MNKLFDWQLENVNATKHNVEGIDLIDKESKIVIQVSSTATKQKIESALTKDLSAYSEYSFKFISISKDAAELRKQSYKNPHNLDFNPQVDIYDIGSILTKINVLGIERQRDIYSFIKQELGKDTDQTKIAAFQKVKSAMPNLLSEMRADLSRKDNELIREFFLVSEKWAMNYGNNRRFVYYYEKHDNLDGKIHILENYGFVSDVTTGGVKKYRMTEGFVELLLTL
jgi:uncharacterized protein YdcH (DUF465 family)